MTETRTPVLEARDLHLEFEVGRGNEAKTVHAVDGVNLKLYEGEITALVGESGSGKTTIARVFALMYKPTRGEVLYRGKPIYTGRASKRGLNTKQERAYYENVQLIFQDPFNSLNSLKKIKTIIGRVLQLHGKARTPSEIRTKVIEVLGKVNMTPAEAYLERYPTDLSGGQRQRIAIARALSVQPRVILADEPTSMLDASIRLDVLNLLSDLRATEKLAVLYITHDIASARYLSDRIHVMYGGRTVEEGPTEEVIANPKHPYTELLLASAPDPARYKGSGRSALRQIVDATPVDNSKPSPGCRFSERCPKVLERCATEPPPVTRNDTRSTACWLVTVDDLFTKPVSL